MPSQISALENTKRLSDLSVAHYETRFHLVHEFHCHFEHLPMKAPHAHFHDTTNFRLVTGRCPHKRWKRLYPVTFVASLHRLSL